MAKIKPASVFIGIAIALGVVLAGLAGFLGEFAWILIGLAQIPTALGVSWFKQTRLIPPLKDIKTWGKELLPLTLLWGGAQIATTLAVIWPWRSLQESNGLGAVLGLSTAVSLLLLVIWRNWPLWFYAQTQSGSLSDHQQLAVAENEASAWRGMGVAGYVLLCTLGGVLVAFPGDWSVFSEWIAVGYAVVLPLIHWGIQSIEAPEILLAPWQQEAPIYKKAKVKKATKIVEPEPEIPLVEETVIENVLDENSPELDSDLHSDDAHAQLFAAARNGQVDQALKLLLAGGVDISRPPEHSRDQRSLIVLATLLPDLRLLQQLMLLNVDVNQDANGMSPLLVATRDSWHGRPDAVMLLLEHNATPRVTDNDGNTPLHHAARSTDPTVAALLLEAGAERDALNNEKLSPLAIACVAGNWTLAKFLLEKGASPAPYGGQPILLAAASTVEDDPTGVQLLLKHRAMLNARGDYRRTALHIAVQTGHVDIVISLLKAGADIEARDQFSRTPWLEAASAGHLGTLEVLLHYNPDVSVVDHQKRNALMLACAAPQISAGLIERLMQLGISPVATDKDGVRAVEIAAHLGRWNVVAQLDPQFPLPSNVVESDDTGPRDSQDRAPLALLRDGLKTGQYEGLPTLLPSLAELCSAQELGRLLHDPVIMLKPNAVDWLLSYGVPAELRDASGDTPLFAMLARAGEAIGSLQVMLRHGISPAGKGGLTRLLVSCIKNDHVSRQLEQLALDLLDKGADPFTPTTQGDPPLALAIHLNWLRLQKHLLALGADLKARDSHGITALHLATALGRESALKLLITYGACPHDRAADGQTPLGVALATGRRDLVRWLDWQGWQLPLRPLTTGDFVSAAIAGDEDAVVRLLELGLPVNGQDEQGCTALLRAAGSGHLHIVQRLLTRGANLQLPANSGVTPLSASVSMRHIHIVTALLHAGAPLDQRLPGGVSVLMLACALGLPDIAARLLNAGANVHSGDNQGLLPLHCAAYFGFSCLEQPRLLALFDTLLLAGADLEHPDAGGATPLLLLLGARAAPNTNYNEGVILNALERLLEEEVALDIRDNRGFSALHLAALHGMQNIIKRLLEAGANPQITDQLNRTPRDIALLQGFIDIATLFDTIPA